MPHTCKRSFYPRPSSISNKLVFDNSSATIWKDGLRSRFWKKKNLTTCQILILKKTARQNLISKFYNASDFGLKKIQCVRFWNKIFSTCQILKNCLHSEITYWFILLLENEIFYIFCAFLKAWFWIWNFIMCQILIWQKYNASDF